MKKKLTLIILSFISINFCKAQDLHEKIKVKIVEYGISDDGAPEIIQLNQYIDFTQPMTMNYTGTFYGVGADESTSTTWYLKDDNNDGFPDGIGYSQEQTYLDTHSTSQHEFIDFTMAGFKEFDKNLFCNGFLVLSNGGVDAEAYYKLQLEPLITITQPDDNDIACNDIVINTNEVSKGFSSNSYIWQYHLGDSNWVNFSDTYQGASSLRLNSTYFNNYLGNVFIRISSCSLVSETVTYNVITCSPELDSIETQEVTCLYETDGSFVLNLKRDLYPNEKLAIIVYEQNTISGEFDIIKDQNLNIESLEKISETNYRYTWTNTLSKGSYKLKYQTGVKGTEISPDDISWSSLIPVDFTIDTPIKVTFSITGTSDKTCFEVNDGYIDLSADGEADRTFLYQLKREGIVQFFNGTSWINYTGTNEEADTWFAFENAKTTRINKLNKGKHQVKVKDSQGCFAR